MANETQRLYDLLTNRITAARAGYLDELVAGGSMHDALIADAAGANIAADIIAVKAETALIVEDTGTTIPGTITTLQTAVTAIKAVTDVIPDAGALTALLADIAAILVDTDTTIPGTITTLQTAVTAIKAVTDVIPDAGALTALLADIAAILLDTGTDGVVLNSLTGAAETAIEAEVEDALQAQNLDHLMAVVMGAALDTIVMDDTVLGFLLAKSDVSTYSRATDSLEAISEAVAALSEAGLTYGTAITGSVTPIDGTENDIVATDGTGDWASDFEIFLSIDLSVMGASDTVVINVYKTIDGTNERLADTQEFSGVQTIKCWEMDALWGDEVMDVRVALQQTAMDGGYKEFFYRGGVRKPSS